MERNTGGTVTAKKVMVAFLVVVVLLLISALVLTGNSEAQGQQSIHRSNISKVEVENGKYVCFMYHNVANGTQSLSCLEADS